MSQTVYLNRISVGLRCWLQVLVASQSYKHFIKPKYYKTDRALNEQVLLEGFPQPYLSFDLNHETERLG